jgi:hypothetical protein
MFRWYKHAQVCYAYLEDVKAPVELDSNISPKPSVWTATILEESLVAARWFTRGWTLQEMIAPSDLKFYASGWTFFGTNARSLCN